MSFDKSMLKRLESIGQNVAQLWGAEMIRYQIEHDEEKVLFECIEHGERFLTELTFEQLAQYDN